MAAGWAGDMLALAPSSTSTGNFLGVFFDAVFWRFCPNDARASLATDFRRRFAFGAGDFLADAN